MIQRPRNITLSFSEKMADLLSKYHEQEATVQRVTGENFNLQDANCVLKEKLKSSEMRKNQLEADRLLLNARIAQLEKELKKALKVITNQNPPTENNM